MGHPRHLFRYRHVVSRETLVILNPASAAGATGRHRASILERIESALGPMDVVDTSAPREARRIAQEAAKRGVDRIIVAGGDGTASEIASGLLESSSSAEHPRLGLLPLGSGWDLARSLGLPRTLEAALAVISRGHARRIDAGRVELQEAVGEDRSSYFVNEVSAGLSGVTVERVGSLAKRIGPRLGFVAGAVGAILSHRPFTARVEIDGEGVYEGPVSMVVAANGKFFGAGMKVAPNAKIDDARIEVVLVRGLSVPRLLGNLPSFYFGRHGDHPSVTFHSARTLEVIPIQGSSPVDVDGESFGALPMRAEVIPGALEIFVPESVE
jgi:YegS/Rv2252/BmrU family lipid kinase